MPSFEGRRDTSTMQTLNLHRPHMPDLQFVLLVTALCTSRLPALNIPNGLRTTIFDRCWMLIHDSPPPRKPEERVLDLRPWSEMTVEAMVETIRATLTEAASGTVLETTGVHPDPGDNEVWQLIGEMATLMAALAPAMKRRAADLAAGGKAVEVVDKLLKGAEVMHGSGHMYLTWARHYASLSESSAEEAEEN